MDERLERYLKASQVYVERQKLDKEVIGVIISGSILNASLDKNSDIDVQVILHPDCTYRERGNTWIDGIEVEYFKNPPAQIKVYFAREKERPLTAHMLAFGTIAFSKSSIIHELVSTAKSIIAQLPPPLKPHELEFHKYFLDDYFKDLEDAIVREDPIGANLIRQKIVNRCIDIFCKTHQVRRGKDKRLREQLGSIDVAFQQNILTALSEHWQATTSIMALKIITERLLGGRRSQEWKMRSELDLE